MGGDSSKSVCGLHIKYARYLTLLIDDIVVHSSASHYRDQGLTIYLSDTSVSFFFFFLVHSFQASISLFLDAKMLLRAATIAVLLEASSVLARVLNTREATGNSIVRATDKSVKLSATSSKHHVVILDYGQNYEGHPAFEVVSSSGDTSGFELTFAESRYSFSNYMVCIPQLSTQQSCPILTS